MVLAAGFLAFASGQGEAGSLWYRRAPRLVSLYRDTKARRPGDLLTVVISESTDVVNRDTRSLEKDSGSGFNFSFGQSTGADFGTANYAADGSGTASNNRSFSGGAQYSSDRGFNDQFTVQVTYVDANGNLGIRGQRSVLVEGDQRTLVLTGIIRGYDIRADNSVISQHVANMELRYEGQGVESRFVNQGWLSRGLNKLWPF